ncbi:terminase large subunit [Cryobacterium sp. 10S3]|uniref:terminase large subunit domain-containing protein n=1 Tax=Cryobacterium sp. 10S3 TaxID=3048582 RepID=UPI002AC8F013|nr:terminase family protein [Cryobacterium sp. 10S3]MEB0286168.1 terminase large subunit [Cryobacterium sp. 10S3]WPX12226.1 terminase family protein [Cryobacterium sp. 10S3]
MPWQSDAFDVAFEVDSFGILWYREIVIVVPRQSGKTTLVIPWGVHRCTTWPDRQLVVYTAQTRQDAKEKLVEDQFWLINRSPFRRLLKPSRSGRIEPNMSHGEEHMRWQNGSKWAIDAPTEKAGHGKTLHLGIGDEIFSHADARVEAAMSPAMITVEDSQKLWISTAGKTKARSPFLWGKVEAGRNRVTAGLNSRSLFIEFSAPEDADWLDPLVWWRTMPALGYTQTQEKVEAEAETLGEDEFRRAYLNQWKDDRGQDWKIPAEHWNAAKDRDSKMSGTLVWVVDVSPERARASISVAAQRPDGKIHLETVETSEGTAWLIDGDPTRDLRGLAALVADHGGDVYFDFITVGALVPDMRDAGLHPHAIATEDVKVAAAALFDGVVNGRVRHLGQAELTDALASAATRKIGDGWAWSRGASMADITALVSATLAFWMLAKTLPDLNYDALSGIG